MRLARQVRPISFLKANAARIVADLKENREPLVITQNGEAALVIQDIESFDQQKQTVALLKLLVLRSNDFEQDAMSLDDAFSELEGEGDEAATAVQSAEA